MSILGDRIKKERENLNLTRDDLAKMIGVSYSAISMYEQGKREPNNELIIKMCELFNCSTDYLIGRSFYRTRDEFFKSTRYSTVALEFSEESIITIIDIILNELINSPNKDLEYISRLIYSRIAEYNIPYKSISSIADTIKCVYENGFSNSHEFINNYENFIVTNEAKYENKRYTTDNSSNNRQFYMCPVYGQISAGIPNWAEECIERRLPIDPVLFNIINPEEHFFLRINGESMNKVIRNGAYALIHKQDMVENGEIAVVLVNGYEATLKKFTKQGDVIVLEPMSNDNTFQTQIYSKDTPIQILGKYIGKFEMNK